VSLAVPRDGVTLGRRLGAGNFGAVHEGSLAGPAGPTVVAVKVPAPAERAAFELEIKIMSTLVRLGGHRHIVGVVGCVSGGGDGATGGAPMLLLELCGAGDLKGVLTGVVAGTRDQFPALTLLRFGREVAFALGFLERHNVLHRDVAARNVLVTDGLVCKLGDFGLSRDLRQQEYYRLTAASAPIPIRWMAPEVLTHGLCTPASERWSFAVLLWEIFSLGARPYASMQTHDVLPFIQAGDRLPRPALCPPPVYGMMARCWAAGAADRPTFQQIAPVLRPQPFNEA